MTVAQLKEAIKDMPDDGVVVVDVEQSVYFKDYREIDGIATATWDYTPTGGGDDRKAFLCIIEYEY